MRVRSEPLAMAMACASAPRVAAVAGAARTILRTPAGAGSFLLFCESQRYSLSCAACTTQRIAQFTSRSFTSSSGNAIMASAAPSEPKAFSAACTPVVKLFSLTVSSLPMPTSRTRSAATPSTARSSKVLPGLPLMSPDFSAAEIAPLLSSDFAAGDSFLFSNTATAMHPLLAVPRVLLVSNAFMLKSIWFSVFIY